MGPLGIQEIVLIFVIALIVFGPKKLPELGRTVGKALGELRRASNDIKRSIEKEIDETELKN
jgi:sec-independent protein translocase protein TatA